MLALEYAHITLDETPSARVTIYTEDAEVGFPERPVSEELLMSEALASIPSNWYSSIPEGIDLNTPSTSANSWLSKVWQSALPLGAGGSSYAPLSSILTRTVKRSHSEVEGR